VVQVGVRTPETDVDAVAASIEVLGVERLVDVAYELYGKVTHEQTTLFR
jgi:hypothetical protein